MKINTDYNWLEAFVECHTPEPPMIVGNAPLHFRTEEIVVDKTKLCLYCDLCKNIIDNKAFIVYMSDRHVNKAFCEECHKKTNYGYGK